MYSPMKLFLLRLWLLPCSSSCVERLWFPGHVWRRHAGLEHEQDVKTNAGLDILEEVLANGQAELTARQLAEQGAIAALVNCSF